MNFIDYFVSKYDTQNQFEILKNYYQQIDFALSNNYPVLNFNINHINNIVISGLGGSAISGDLIKNLFKDELKIPLQVNRNYQLPAFVNENTLVICSSYSGDTEETISACNEAIIKKSKIVCISTGGKLEKIANEYNLSYIKLPEGFQPRFALAVSIATLIKLFELLKIIPSSDQLLIEISYLLHSRSKELTVENNIATHIALELIGFIPIIYSVCDYNNSIGLRLKSQINENSKLHAFHSELPEMNHNEIIGWEKHQQKIFNSKVIFVIDDDLHPRIKKRFSIISDMIKSSDTEIITLKSSEKNFKMRLIDLVYLADWISYYLSIFRKFDPSEIEFIHTLKKKLSEV